MTSWPRAAGMAAGHGSSFTPAPVVGAGTVPEPVWEKRPRQPNGRLLCTATANWSQCRFRQRVRWGSGSFVGFGMIP